MKDGKKLVYSGDSLRRFLHRKGLTYKDAAKELGVSIRWGGDWNMDGNSKDEQFYDGPHFELLRSKYP